jgi:DNA-binding LytR/AlgR family response regulator
MSERAPEVLAPLIARVRADRPLADKLPVTCAGRVLLVPVGEISHCAVEHELVVVYTRGQSFTTDYTLAALEARLDASRFFRAHRALLVNLDHVAAIDDLPGGRSQLVTDAGAKLVVSRQASRRLRGLLGV